MTSSPMKALNKQVSKMSEAELIRAIAEASELRPRDGRDVVALRIYEQVLKPLLDEQSELETRVANESDCADSTINLAINWQMRCKDAEAKLETAESKCREQTEFLAHIKKCLVKNGEYAPLSHEEIDTLLGIRADGKGAAL